MSSLIQKVREWVDKGLILGFLAGMFVYGSREAIISSKISVSNPQYDTALQTLQLIALLLPAIAILSQILIDTSYNGAFSVTGEGAKLRWITFLAAGVSFFFSMIAVVIIIGYLQTPPELGAPMILVSFSIFAITTPLFAVAYWYQDERIRFIDQMVNFQPEFEKFDDIHSKDEEEFKKIIGLLDPPEDYLEDVLDEGQETESDNPEE